MIIHRRLLPIPFLTTALCTLVLAFPIATASAASIGFNFTSDRDNGAQPGAGESAGVVAQQNWNNFGNIPSNGSGINDSTAGIDSPNAGQVTEDNDGVGTVLSGVTVSWLSVNAWNTNNGSSNGDNKLMNGYLDNNAGSPNVVVNVNNLPAHYTSGYTVIAYFGSDGNGRTGTVEINDSTDVFSFSTNSNTGGGFPGAYVQTTDTGGGNPSANYAMWENVTTPNLRVTLRRGSSNCGLHAVQIIASAPSGAASVENSPATSVTSSSATLPGTVTDIGDAAPSVTIHYGTTDGGTDPGMWDNSVTLPGTQTGAFSRSVSGLLRGTDYFFRASATNGSGTSWAPSSESFTTLAEAPTVANLPADEIQTTSARIGADVSDTGGEAPTVRVYYGLTDQGTNAGAWDDSVLLGTVSTSAAATISGLQTNSLYYFRALATNNAASSWAPSSASFMTAQPIPPTVVNRQADGISGTSANLRGEVTDLGFEAPSVTLFYGAVDGGTSAGGWANSANLGVRTGDFSLFVSGLDPLTTYYYRARATNVAGSSWAPASATFTTTDLVSSAIVINEIHYDHDPKTERAEFLEIYNASDDPVDLAGWKLDGAVDYTFPPGTTIAANGFVVVAENPTAFASAFGGSALGPYTGRLNNDGERLELENQFGETIDEVDYGIGFPWPTASRGAGASMELINETLDNDLGSSWRASTSGFSGPQVTYIPAGETWSYRKGTSEASVPRAAWRLQGFSQDASWLAGGTPIGYGDGDDVTVLNDMQTSYASVFLRKEFTVSGAIPTQLLVRVYHDDGAIVWINGVEVARVNVDLGDITFEGVRASNPGGAPGSAVSSHEAAFTDVLAIGAQGYLVNGTNTIAVQGFNSSIGSSDFSIDVELKTPDPSSAAIGVPSPGAANSVFSPNAPPNIRQVDHAPEQPTAGQDVLVTAKVTDPDGMGPVTLSYQLVNPGSYVNLEDAAYEMNWVDLPMVDDGTGGDLVAGDSIYSVTMPGALQTHRRLIRYRITVEDALGVSVQTPYSDDEVPNFAYFCYNGVPDWTASKRPGVEPNLTYAGSALDTVAVYHLISKESDVIACQWTGPNDGQYRYLGTMVYDGKVYDHMRYRIRGNASTYQVGRNKWKLNFPRAHGFEARDNYGRKYDVPWDKINVLPGSNPWWRNNASTDGTLYCESVGFRIYQLAGGVGSNTQFFHFRVIDDAEEAPANDQYGGDFWGVYIAIEQPEAEFLNERGLPDGNLYNVHGGSGSSKRNQGATQNTDFSDLFAFQGLHNSGTSEAQWNANLDFDSYFAWNACNLAINNSDLRPQENVNYYHNSETGKWHILPWDQDLTFEDAPHLGRGDTPAWERIYHCLQYPAINQAYENRVRHIMDLLLDNDQSAHLVDEYAYFVTQGGPNNIVEASQAMWDYHPRKRKKGIWYANFNTSLMPTRDFAAYTQYTKDFMTVGGYGRENLAAKQVDSAIPNKPTITYTGLAGFPTNGLTFQSSAFSDPQGAGTFGSMEWRLGEIHNPSVAAYVPGDRYVYEIDTFWSSGELTSFQSTIDIPAQEVRIGRTYRARVRHIDSSGKASHWSDPVEFTAALPDVTPYQNGLVVSQFNYHPAEPVTPAELAQSADKNDYEYLEILNVGATPLDLTDVRFTKGIDFDFAGSAATSIGPDQRVVIVKNLAAFSARYADKLGTMTIAGEWDAGDNLSNGGENIRLSIGSGVIIREFTYDDSLPWPTAADGGGYSLVLKNPASLPDHSNASSWRLSTDVLGCPGSGDAMPFVGTPGEDTDCDGVVDLLEHAMGTDPNLAGGAGTLVPQSAIQNLGGVDYLTISFQRNLAADDVALEAEISADLGSWNDMRAPVLVSEVPNGDGTTTVTYRGDLPINASEKQFLRLKATLLP